MRMKAGEQEAKSREFVDGSIDDTRWIEPVKLSPVAMLLPPLLCCRQVAEDQAHQHGQKAIGNGTKQRRIACTG